MKIQKISDHKYEMTFSLYELGALFQMVREAKPIGERDSLYQHEFVDLIDENLNDSVFDGLSSEKIDKIQRDLMSKEEYEAMQADRKRWNSEEKS